jgi:hypothetical protein
MSEADEIDDMHAEWDSEEKRAAGVKMAKAMIRSLQALRVYLLKSPDDLQKWRDDPIQCLSLVIDTLEDRHVKGKTRL